MATVCIKSIRHSFWVYNAAVALKMVYAWHARPLRMIMGLGLIAMAGSVWMALPKLLTLLEVSTSMYLILLWMIFIPTTQAIAVIHMILSRISVSIRLLDNYLWMARPR